MATDPPILLHGAPQGARSWSDRISYGTLAALIDKLAEGERLYFTHDGVECYVLALRPKIARLGRPDRKVVTDFQGNAHRSRGQIVADELRGIREVQEGMPLVVIECSWVSEEQLVTPHPVGRMLCNECGGTGEVVLFQLPSQCVPCEGTGWMGGKRVTGSSENHADAEAREATDPGNEKGNT